MTIDISNIKPGDTVTAKFSDGWEGDFVINGPVRELNTRLFVAGWKIAGPAIDGPTNLVEIVAHVPFEPPVGLYADEFSDYWVHLPKGWIRLTSSMINANAKTWAEGPASTYSMTEVTA